MISRRKFLTGALAAPLVVKAGILMPVQSVIVPDERIVRVDVAPEGDMAVFNFHNFQFPHLQFLGRNLGN
jgi:hypothetical protein